MKKRVVAMFDVEYDEGQWTPSDIALALEMWAENRGQVWENATVWDSLDDFIFSTDNQQTETDMDMLRITEQDKMIAVPTGSAAALTDGLAIAIEALKEVALDGHLFDFLGSTHEPVHETLTHLRNILATHGVRKGD